MPAEECGRRLNSDRSAASYVGYADGSGFELSRYSRTAIRVRGSFTPLAVGSRVSYRVELIPWIVWTPHPVVCRRNSNTHDARAPGVASDIGADLAGCDHRDCPTHQRVVFRTAGPAPAGLRKGGSECQLTDRRFGAARSCGETTEDDATGDRNGDCIGRVASAHFRRDLPREFPCRGLALYCQEPWRLSRLSGLACWRTSSGRSARFTGAIC